MKLKDRKHKIGGVHICLDPKNQLHYLLTSPQASNKKVRTMKSPIYHPNLMKVENYELRIVLRARNNPLDFTLANKESCGLDSR